MSQMLLGNLENRNIHLELLCTLYSSVFAAVRLIKFWVATSRTAIHMAIELPQHEAELEERLRSQVAKREWMVGNVYFPS